MSSSSYNRTDSARTSATDKTQNIMSSSLDDSGASKYNPTSQTPERTALISEIRRLEKSTKNALRTTADELERLESTSSQTRSTIDHLERKLKVLDKKKRQQQQNGEGHGGRRNSDNGNGTGGGVNKKLNSFLTRSITIHGGNEQLEELRSRRSSLIRGNSISNLRESIIGGVIPNMNNNDSGSNSHNNNSDGNLHHQQDGPPPTRRPKHFGSNRSSISRSNRSSMSRSIGASGHSFSLGVSNHSRLTNLLSGLATHDSGDEESSSTSSSSTALDLLSSSSSSSESEEEESNSSNQSRSSKNKLHGTQINELSSTLQLKKDQMCQLKHDHKSNAVKLSMVQSELYKVNREYRQLVRDHELKMKLLQDVHKNKWCNEYVNMRTNSVIRAEERFEMCKSRVEELEAQVEAKIGGRKKGVRASIMAPLLNAMEEDVRRYQVRIRVEEYRQRIVEDFVAGLEENYAMGLENDQQADVQQQQQGEDDSCSDSGCSTNECPTGGEEAAANNNNEDEEDLSYIIGKEEGLSLRHSVEDSDISETATEEEESVLLPTNGNKSPSVQTNSNSPNITTKRHLTILITGGNFNPSQTANQRATLQLLADLSLPHVTIDGMDPSQRERRNELFGISGVRGNYPQIFVSTVIVDGDEGEDGGVESKDVFLGGYEWLECCDLEELKGLLVVSGESDKDGEADSKEGEEMKDDEQRHDMNAVNIEGHLKSLEKAIKIMEGRVEDFEVLSATTSGRQRMDETSAANRLYSLTKQCADVLDDFTTKTSDIISSSLEMQPSALTSNDPDASANTTADEANTNIQQELISQIEQTKSHLTQLEQSRDACNADIEQLQNEIKSMELAMEEQNQSNYEVFTEIQTKMGMLTKRLEDGSNEIRGLVKELTEWSSREEMLLKAQRHSRGIGFIR